MNDTIYFTKMNGLGNEIIVADMRGRTDSIPPKAAIALNTTQDTAYDQIMAVYDGTDEEDYRIDILNSDGSLAEACGNGTRCVVEWLYAQNSKDHFIFATKGGRVEAWRHDISSICVDMGKPRFDWYNIPVSREIIDTNHVNLGVEDLPDACLVSMGNPHAIFFIQEDIWSKPLEKLGPALENHPLFPKRANISFANIIDKETIHVRTWERGAGLTRACGTAACATAVAANRRALTRRKTALTLPGGILQIEWRNDDHVLMSGPAEFEFTGTFNRQTGAYQRDQK